MAMSLAAVAPAAASYSQSRPVVTGHALAPHLDAPLTAYNKAGLQKEVFGFAPYWALSQESGWDYNVISTFSYFGLSFDGNGNFIKSGGGYFGYRSTDLIDLINRAHNAGDRVLLTIKGSGQSALFHLLTTPGARQAAISNTINAIFTRNMDGVNIDFEGYTSSSYPGIQAGLTQFTTDMSAQVHARWPKALVTIDTYSGSASWDFGLMRIDALAPVVDAMFIMAYDMSFSNMPGHAGPNSPMTGWTYNLTLSVSQYLTKAPASKIILGLPWYGYRFKTANNALYATTSGATPDTYAAGLKDLACGKNLVRHWDGPSQSPWASWYSPASGDPCGMNLGSWQELYYENVQSLGAKYGLVNSSGIRGMGIWALGYDGGAPELWSQLNTYFACPVNLAVAPTQATTEFTVGLSAGSCSVRSMDVEQYDGTQNHGWYPFKSVSGGSATITAQGFPGYTYLFRARAHSTAGRVSAWTTVTTSVNADATYSHPFKGLYTLDAYGGISADSSPPVFTAAYWPGSPIARAAKALPGNMPQSGAVLDGFGGLHYYGAPITLTGSPYWRGWNIARDFAFLPDGSGGYVLDGYGGLHPFAVNGAPVPPAVQGAAYWGGKDIARKVVIFSDGTGGYVMDAYGGLHAFGIGVPAPVAATGGPYWTGWAIARDVVLVPGSHAGYVLDGYGGLHPFSGASALATPVYWGWDIARSVWLLPASTLAAPAGYLMDGFGGLHPFGGAPVLTNVPYWGGHDIARNLTGY
jgi:spore germination protein YaaH